MKLKNRKGSTLALTLMVFAVLMIFATFILSFMVTENKQAMYHQNKTQAYYIARSGAVAVEAAIIKEYEKDKVGLLNSITHSPKDISISNLNFENGKLEKLTVEKIELGEVDNNIQKYLITIKSKASAHDNTIYKLEKIIPIEISTKTEKKQIPNSSPITYLDPDAHNNMGTKVLIDYKGAKKGDSINYPLYKFDYKPFSNVLEKVSSDDENFESLTSITIGSVIAEGNYVVNGILDLKSKNITIKGKVNIYVKDYVELQDSTIIYDKEIKDSILNIFIYGESLNNGNSLMTPNKAIIDIQSNFYIDKGNVFLDLFKASIDGNIVIGEQLDINKTINITSQDNSGTKPTLKGVIYAPQSTIKFGGDEEDENNKEKAALVIKGYVVGNNVEYIPKKANQYKEQQIKKKLTIDNSENDGITSPPISETIIVIDINPGYFENGE